MGLSAYDELRDLPQVLTFCQNRLECPTFFTFDWCYIRYYMAPNILTNDCSSTLSFAGTNHPKRLEGQIVVITGGNSGIGEETSFDLARFDPETLKLEFPGTCFLANFCDPSFGFNQRLAPLGPFKCCGTSRLCLRSNIAPVTFLAPLKKILDTNPHFSFCKVFYH